MDTPVALYRRMPGTRRRSRRILVVAAFLGYPLLILGYSALVAPGVIPTVVWAPISVALFAATIIGAVAIYGYGQGRINDRARLDERQRSILDQALVVSYGVLTTFLVIVAGVLATYLSFVGPIQLDMGALGPWLIAIGVYVPLLPFAALAWIEPDVPADDA